MKSVMVLIHDDASQEARLQCALDVVRAVEGHLLCLDVVQMPVVTDEFGLGGGAGVLLIDEREREDSNVERLEPRLANEGVSYEWARVHSHSDASIIDNARLVDLLVVGKHGVGDIAESGDCAARLAGLTSVPVLVVPSEQRRFDLLGKAMVAWDGSAPADAAVRAATPLLKLAGEVEVLTIDEGEENADPAAVAAYLDRHGCTVSIREEPKSGSVAPQLLAALEASGAAWCVMGAYGRGRLREQLFGGASRTLLAKASVPLLISR